MAMGERPQTSNLNASVKNPQPPTLVDTCTASSEGYSLIREFEGFIPFIYDDIGGKATIGYGHLVLEGETFPQPLLPADAYRLLEKDVNRIATRLNKDVTAQLQQNHCDALLSFSFNLGSVKRAAPTLLQFVNQERHDDAAKQFLVYNRVRINGKLVPVAGLTRRRVAESELYARD